MPQDFESILREIVREEVTLALRNVILPAIVSLGKSADDARKPPPPNELMTVNQVAEHCRVTPPTVRLWINSRRLPAQPLSPKGRSLRVQRADLERFLAHHGERVTPDVDREVERLLSRVRRGS